MVDALSTAATGMDAQERYIGIIAHNIANVNTAGFKMNRPEFQDLFYFNQKRLGTSTSDTGTMVPAGIQIGLGVNMVSVHRIHLQGDIYQTEENTHLAILGKGYFRIQMPDGSFGYQRDGTFLRNQNGEIVNHLGYVVAPGIVIPPNTQDITIAPDGRVEAKIAGIVQPQQLGQIELVKFINEAGLEAIGDNLFLETEASGDPVAGIPGTEGIGLLKQGWLENSNVNAITELTTMIKAQRAYEMSSNVIKTVSEMKRQANSAINS